MTVKELIDMLGECNPKATVYLFDYYGQPNPSSDDLKITSMEYDNNKVHLTNEDIS